uniref:Uncharacterized protein n=1 Tax=viral metagenome TaxID=1070528 RepID=A0A6M3IT43_9ZZZZ
MANVTELQYGKSFSELKALVVKIVDRGGDSVIDTSLAGDYVNFAEQYISGEVGAPYWLGEDQSLTVPASTSEVTMEANVEDVQSIRDEENNRFLSYMDRDRFDAFIVNHSDTSGTPLRWTKYGYNRRTNVESPATAMGGIKLQFWPVPSSATTLKATVQLIPGMMVNDSDYPAMPPQWHMAIVEWAAHFAGAYDIGSKAYREHFQLAMRWLLTIKRRQWRNLAGNQRFIGREEYMRRHGGSAPIAPPTRLSQLQG